MQYLPIFKLLDFIDRYAMAHFFSKGAYLVTDKTAVTD